jgi:chromosome partitioning protein
MWLGIGSVKGGVGTTTAALELAYAATRRRVGRRLRRVALIDLDPQGGATDAVEPVDRTAGVKDVLAPGRAGEEPLRLREILVPTAWPRVLLAQASRELANRERDLTPQRMHVLRKARDTGEIADLVDDVIIDLSRNSGRVALSGMLAAEKLLITARASMWAFQGAEEMTYTALRVREAGNPGLEICGYVVSEFEEKPESLRILGDMKSRYQHLVHDPPIPRNPLVSEALESYHTPCREFSNGALVPVADGYQAIYDRLLEKERNPHAR